LQNIELKVLGRRVSGVPKQKANCDGSLKRQAGVESHYGFLPRVHAHAFIRL